MDKYDNGLLLKKAGVVSGDDITIEAAVVKLMFVLGQDQNVPPPELQIKVQQSISGEISR
jgi:L-asparaginase